MQPQTPRVFTHKELVEIAYKWVLKNASCGIAFKELVTSASEEIADVIGFGAWQHSVLIECKVSRSDFFSDKKKIFRQYPERGMGRQRFYCCPKGLINKEELPEGWGLLYVDEKGKCRAEYSPYNGNIEIRHKGFQVNVTAEMGVMYSALRRLHLRGRIVEIYEELQQKRDERKRIMEL